MTARIDRQPAYVLHRRPYRESSLLLDLLTRDHGRVAVMARAARGGARGRNQGSASQPFQALLVSWSGRGDLKTLTGVERGAGACVMPGERLYSALYINELLVRVIPQYDAHPTLFDAYALLLSALAGSQDVEPLLRDFEIGLLRELGYELEFNCEASTGRALEAAARYLFTPGSGLSRSDDLEDQSAYSGKVLQAIARSDYGEADTRRSAKRLLRRALAELLGDKPLRSREYFSSRGGSGHGGAGR